MIYGEIDFQDVGSPFKLDVGDIRCKETGDLYTGTFIIQDLKYVRKEDIKSDKQL